MTRRITFRNTMGDIVTRDYISTMPSGRIVVDEGNGWEFHVSPDNVISDIDVAPENVAAHNDAVRPHTRHDLEVSDDAMDDDAEEIVWCNTCNVTVWYVESEEPGF